MPVATEARIRAKRTLPKCLTGIAGFDEVTLGGLPRGRPTLVCGAAGCGKTLFGMEFLIRGARDFGEPGVCITFEENAEDLEKNVRSLGFDVEALVEAGKIAIDQIQIDPNQIAETGDYDLEGLFIRIGSAIDSVKAKRVLLDTPEALFAGLQNQGVLRSELRRLFAWLKDRGVTAVITGEKGEGTLTRHGLEEYVSDCVVLLDNRVSNGVVTRRLRVLKYRGSTHGTNEYPFLIDTNGISVLPLTSLALAHEATEERVSSGMPKLDEMLGQKGYYRGSSILLMGPAGTGKTTLAAAFLDAACRRGENALYVSFEESPSQLIRNMRSIGLDLEPWVRKGLLVIEANRPSTLGLEMHLVRLHQMIAAQKPRVVVIDPLTSLLSGGADYEVKSMVLRLVDFLKHLQTTALFTALSGAADLETTDLDLSSLVDTWLLVRNLEIDGERNRGIYVLKSRGMPHSNQIREFVISSSGLDLREVYLGPTGVLTGSARVAREEQDRQEEMQRQRDFERQRVNITRGLTALEAQMAALEAEKAARSIELDQLSTALADQKKAMIEEREAIARSRRVAPASVSPVPGKAKK